MLSLPRSLLLLMIDEANVDDGCGYPLPKEGKTGML
jgi:hypothetical protein